MSNSQVATQSSPRAGDLDFEDGDLDFEDGPSIRGTQHRHDESLMMIREIGPNEGAAQETKAHCDAAARQAEARAEEEKARQASAATQEQARQTSAAEQEKARQLCDSRNHRESQKTLRLGIVAFLSLFILIFCVVSLWLAGEKGWPKYAYLVIGGLTALSLGGNGVVAYRQTGQPQSADEK